MPPTREQVREPRVRRTTNLRYVLKANGSAPWTGNISSHSGFCRINFGPLRRRQGPAMPIIWTKFPTHEECEQAIARLLYAGFDRSSIDRIQGNDGQWSIRTDVDERDAPRIHALMSDPSAPAL